MYSVETTDQQQDFVRSVRPDRQFTSITIFADASFCPKTRAAGWGAWAKRDGWQAGRFFGGPLRRELASANQAELCALASVVWQLERDGALTDVNSFMLQSDCLAALAAVSVLPASFWTDSGEKSDSALRPRPPRKLSPVEREGLEAIRSASVGRRIYLRHVKGHRAGTARSWVNNQCDAEARRHMRAMRAERQS